MDSAKILVLFRLPEGRHLTCPLQKLAYYPLVGSSYLLGKQVYEVERTIEPLGDDDGNSQLLTLLNTDLPKSSPGAQASVVSLYKQDEQPGLFNAPDRVILVCLKKSGNKNRSSAPALTLDLSPKAIADKGSKAATPARSHKARSSSRTDSRQNRKS